MSIVRLTVGGVDHALRLSLDNLDEISRVEDDFMEIVRKLREGEAMKWSVCRVILSAAFSGTGISLQRFVEERGFDASMLVAGQIFLASMTPNLDEERSEDREAGNAESGKPSLSASDDTSASE